MLVETFPHEGTHYMVAFPFVGWNAHQSLGMLLTRRMATAGYGPLGFIATDYALGAWSVKPVTDHRPPFSPSLLSHEFVTWVTPLPLLNPPFSLVLSTRL